MEIAIAIGIVVGVFAITAFIAWIRITHDKVKELEREREWLQKMHFESRDRIHDLASTLGYYYVAGGQYVKIKKGKG